MNSHQRRKALRKLLPKHQEPPAFIKDWNDLAKVPDSPTHRLDIHVEDCYGYIVDKKTNKHEYLSTHTFYGSTYKRSEILLRVCGFNVRLDNWDK